MNDLSDIKGHNEDDAEALRRRVKMNARIQEAIKTRPSQDGGDYMINEEDTLIPVKFCPSLGLWEIDQTRALVPKPNP